MKAILSGHHITTDIAGIIGDLVDTIDGQPLTLSPGVHVIQLVESCGRLGFDPFACSCRSWPADEREAQ